MKKIFLSICLILVNITLLNAQKTTWESPYIGSSKEVLYLPDANAVYWRYGWERTENDKNGYVIKGKFPDARYFSYNIYDDVTKSSMGSLTDFNIKADDSKNNYTLYIVPEGTVINEKNVLFFKNDLPKVSVILRHYLPNKNIYGNVLMPKIDLFDTTKKTTKEAPKSVAVPKFSKEDVEKYLVPMFQKFMENPQENLHKLQSQSKGKPINIEELICKQLVSNVFNFYKKNNVIYSFNLNSDGTYPNNDNHYLTMPIVRSNHDDVCVVKFRAPNYAHSSKDFPISDVRYFSISQGDELTYNYNTIADYQFKVNSDGFIYIVIANESEQLKTKAKTLGMNFMPWVVNEKMLLIYRNMLPNPNYKKATNSVPKLDKSKPIKEQTATNFIGNFAPIGFFFTMDSFLNSKTIPAF